MIKFLFKTILHYVLIYREGARDNFRDNAAMSRSRKMVACRVVAKYSKIVALLLSRRKLSLIFATSEKQIESYNGMAQSVERWTASTVGTVGYWYIPGCCQEFFLYVVCGGWWVVGDG